MRRGCGLVVAVVLVAVAGCSSPGSPAAAGSPTVTASAPPTGPSMVVCQAARSLVAQAQPTFSADATASTEQQSGDDSAFYTQLLQVFSENGGADPLSLPVSQDAGRLAQDYGALQLAAQQTDLDGQTKALQSLSADLEQLAHDQVPFDTACGIPHITSTD